MKLALTPSRRLRALDEACADDGFRVASLKPTPSDEGALEARNFDSIQDTALYSCGCGLVFDAPVSASVGCPHCGDRQAW